MVSTDEKRTYSRVFADIPRSTTSLSVGLMEANGQAALSHLLDSAMIAYAGPRLARSVTADPFALTF